MEVELSEPGVNLKWLKNNAIINWGEVGVKSDHDEIIAMLVNKDNNFGSFIWNHQQSLVSGELCE